MKAFQETEFNQLVPLQISNFSNETVNTINARDLWKYLGSKQDFSDWIRNRIKKYSFEDGTDFVRFHNNMVIDGTNLKRKRHDYHLSLDMAKELAMIENNDIGRAVRKYFIQIQKEYRQYSADQKRIWEQSREAGKKIRYSFTDTIAKFQEYAKQQGSTGFGWFFSYYTTLINRELFGCPSLKKIKKNLRDNIDTKQLMKLSTLEDIIVKNIEAGIRHQDHYTEIKRDIIKIVNQFIFMAGSDYPALLDRDELRVVIERKYTTNFLNS